MNGRIILVTAFLAAGATVLAAGDAGKADDSTLDLTRGDESQGVVHCANLIYGHSKTSVCFADEFLTQLRKDSNIRTNRRFCPVKLDSEELFQFPFAVMTGEGSFALTEAQRQSLRTYLLQGGFLVASAGCSSEEWSRSFRAEVGRVLPDLKLQRLGMSHPIFHVVYDIDRLDTKHGADAHLEAMIYEGRVVLVYSPDGLNDTRNAGPGCCCCGGNEILNAIKVNANLLAYALTH